jgi:hypothetical protein
MAGEVVLASARVPANRREHGPAITGWQYRGGLAGLGPAAAGLMAGAI